MKVICTKTGKIRATDDKHWTYAIEDKTYPILTENNGCHILADDNFEEGLYEYCLLDYGDGLQQDSGEEQAKFIRMDARFYGK